MNAHTARLGRNLVTPPVWPGEKFPGRSPPYGRDVLKAMRYGRRPNVRLFANRPDPWASAKAHRRAHGESSAMVLPVGADPALYTWPPLSNLLVDITGLDGRTVQALARALVRDGLILGYLLDRNHPERNFRAVRHRGTV